ncbi:MAG: LacI family DNA-binding transcriptional regulator [Actinoplanes sp.]
MSRTSDGHGPLASDRRARRSVTMVDVARAIGVSHQTVSRVLNGHPAVRPDTRARVLQALESLGYRGNPAARALVTRRSRTLGVVSFDSTLYGPASTLSGVEQAARSAGYFVSVVGLNRVTAGTVREAFDRLTSQDVEGIVIIAPLSGTAGAFAALDGDLPVVVVQGGEAPGLASVCVAQEEGARMVTQHLLERGAAAVWHLAGPATWVEAGGRIAGWRAGLREAGVAAPAVLRGDWRPSSGYAAGRRLARRSDVEAVFVGNDQMALGLLRAFHEEGIRVPQDVLVAGFDDVPEAAYYTPPLTTVRQDFAAVGRLSVDVLLTQVGEDGQTGRHLTVAPELVVRQSTTRS